MKATGRRAWRQAGRRFRKAEKRRGFYPANSVGLFARRHWRAAERNIGIVGKQFPPNVAINPFTARSLVGMTMGARKRRWAKDYDALPQFGRFSKTMSMLRAYGVYPREGNTLAQRLRPCPGCCNCQPCYCGNPSTCIGLKYRIGEHLRPCPGCCACWGCEQDLTRVNPVSGNTLHWAGPKRKHTFECSMGPPLAGKKSKHIARMLKWQETLPDDCDGSGVLPARNQK